MDSKSVLQAHLGYPVNWLAYPYGSVNETVANVTQQAGYVGAFGTNHGTYQSTDRMFTEPRIRIGGSDTVNSFAAKIP
jgi:peptidoglycan/xylan/chitin deacetylase (PgdA/CDA1 family)